MVPRYKRAMAPLDAEARARLWESGEEGARISAGGGSVELEELVHAFYSDEAFQRGDAAAGKEERLAVKWRRELEAVLEGASAAEPVLDWMRVEAEAAVRSNGLKCDELVRRRLVRRMSEKGLDAGICECRWGSAAGIPAGTHEYVDVLVSKSRYIVEINLAGEFEIARPTGDYMELLGCLPAVFVGRPVILEAVIGLMCLAAQTSIRTAGMHMPPWRRSKYMREKWFGAYRREQVDSSSSADSRGRMVYAAGQRGCRANTVGIKDNSEVVKSLFLRGM